MFEAELKAKLKRIFGIDKVTYDAPAPDSPEQKCLFISIETCTNTIRENVAISKVEGSGVLFGQAEQVPFGFFSKRIKQADSDDTKDFFFFDLEANAQGSVNLIQRGFNFIYFFNGQYDPETGTITSIDISEV